MKIKKEDLKKYQADFDKRIPPLFLKMTLFSISFLEGASPMFLVLVFFFGEKAYLICFIWPVMTFSAAFIIYAVLKSIKNNLPGSVSKDSFHRIIIGLSSMPLLILALTLLTYDQSSLLSELSMLTTKETNQVIANKEKDTHKKSDNKIGIKKAGRLDD